LRRIRRFVVRGRVERVRWTFLHHEPN
jgi:hypothetical protein